MAFRGNEAPMDFEWQTHAPVDATSPFHKFAMEQSNKNLKRSHSIFDSPQKASAPSLREPNSQPFLFSQTAATPNHPSEFRAPSFMTPRKPVDVDFSSGPENHSSPELADNEDTPDKPPVTFTANNGKSKRNSLFGLYGKWAPSPGRGEIPRTGPYSNALAKRVHKRRRRGQNFEKQLLLSQKLGTDSSDDEADALDKSRDAPPPAPRKAGIIETAFGFLHRLLHLITSHPDAPRKIVEYVWAFSNIALLGFAFLVIYRIWAMVSADINRGNDHAIAQLSVHMSKCKSSYTENFCGTPHEAPVNHEECKKWEACMNQDPMAIRGARVGAQTWASIANGFFDELSWKTIAVFVIFVLVTNITMGSVTSQLRSRFETPRPPSRSHLPLPSPDQHSFENQNQSYANGLDRRHNLPDSTWNGKAIEYARQRSPSKELGRGRSRSPEKKRVAHY